MDDILLRFSDAERQAKLYPGRLIKVFCGLYLVYNGKMHVLEHVTKSEGFSRDEWTISTDNDLHHDQYNTLREAHSAIIAGCTDPLIYTQWLRENLERKTKDKTE